MPKRDEAGEGVFVDNVEHLAVQKRDLDWSPASAEAINKARNFKQAREIDPTPSRYRNLPPLRESDEDADRDGRWDLPRKSTGSGLFARFRPSGRGGLQSRSMNDNGIWRVFAPTKPIGDLVSYIGRRPMLEQTVRIIQEDKCHIVIYGPRGIGKTSTANVLAQEATSAGYHIVRYSCHSGTDFEELFRFLLRNLTIHMVDRTLRNQVPDAQEVEDFLNGDRIAPADVVGIIQHLIEPVIFIVDEFDRVGSESFRTQFAETIKVVSDISDAFVFIIAGVGANAEEVIGRHPSLQRHVRGISVPYMSESELDHLVKQGETDSGWSFAPEARALAIQYSSGVPYLAQLFCLHAMRIAAARTAKRVVEAEDIEEARKCLLIEIDPNLLEQFMTKTDWGRNRFTADLLYAAALSPFDDAGSFSAQDVASVLRELRASKGTLRTVKSTLSRLTRPDEGHLLHAHLGPEGEKRFIFSDPAMRQCILLRQGLRAIN